MARSLEFDPTKVLDEAMLLFWCQGYEATSTQELTHVMGIKPGSLYNTFGDKHTLYLKALDRYQETIGSCMFGVLRDIPLGKKAIQRFFTDLVDVTVADTLQCGCFMLNAIIEVGSHDTDVAQRAEKALHTAETLFLTALQRAQTEGEISPNHDLPQLASFLNSTVQGLRVMGKVNPNRSTLMGIVEIALASLD